MRVIGNDKGECTIEHSVESENRARYLLTIHGPNFVDLVLLND